MIRIRLHPWAPGALALTLLALGAAPGEAQILYHPILGGLPADSGLAAGVEFVRYQTMGPFDARARFTGSVKKYEHVELSLELPPPATNDFFSEIRLRYRNYPEDDFWGLGESTDRNRRSNYRLEDATLTGQAGLHFRSGLRLAAIAGLLETNIGPGGDGDFPSTEAAFTPAETPGLEASPDYWLLGARIDYDRRDNRDDTRSGQLALFEWTRYADRAPGDWSFHRYQLEYRQFLPITDDARVALRARAVLTDTFPGHTIPFYLQPSAGGTDTVRGFNQYRFRSGNSLVFNAEFRQAWKSIVDIIVFADAGRVAEGPSDISLQRLQTSLGVGGRVRLGSNTLFGVDVGFSEEGRHFWFRSGHTF